ncbi:MAG TPA: phosphate/phosphite/phosphonate ABC transporter substrate-binding protein [Caldimonas sp.]|nr:phosphate/phosphite/phosphonate ABC transporter substrate-binding protein [Caldimonas sp.]
MGQALWAAMAALFFAFASPAHAADCPHGELDSAYCVDGDKMVAKPPADPKDWKDPSTIVFAYTPVEDPAVYANAFKPFVNYLSSCTGKKVVYYPVLSNSAEVEAMRSGRLHVAGFSTGPTAFAVNLAGAIPFAIKGDPKAYESYRMIMLVRADSKFHKLTDLKGARVAHTAASSNSGNLAPRALFPELGLVPDKDYKVIYSGGHDRTVLGIKSGDYDAGTVASDVFERMAARGDIKESDFRIIYSSDPFPTSGFAYAHDLKPELAQKIVKCFLDFRFPPEMQKEFAGGVDRFWPATYLKDWAVIRKVADAAHAPYDRAAFDAEAKKEAAKLEKKKN